MQSDQPGKPLPGSPGDRRRNQGGPPRSSWLCWPRSGEPLPWAIFRQHRRGFPPRSDV